jgi:hypothetical protein
MLEEKEQNKTKHQWYKQLTDLYRVLENLPQDYLNDDFLSSHGIQTYDFDIEIDDPLESTPRFFSPLPHERLILSSCDIDLSEHKSTYYSGKKVNFGHYWNGRSLADIISDHLRGVLNLLSNIPRWKGFG